MKSMIVKSFNYFCQFGVVVLIIASVVIGYKTGGIGGAIGGLISGGLAAILVFGILFILMDIRDNTKKVALEMALLNKGSE